MKDHLLKMSADISDAGLRLNLVREYIVNNPIRWELDIENPDAVHRKTLEEYYEFTG